MGQLHREHVYETPPGWLTIDERCVLLVLADETPDFHMGPNGRPDRTRPRLEWVHRPEELMPKLGLDHTRTADKAWLSRRLKALEDAGFITRRKRRRREDGTWMLPSVRLELSAGADVVAPTERAAKGDPRASNLNGRRPVDRDGRGQFKKESTDAPDGAVSARPDGAVSARPDGHHRALPMGVNRTQPDLKQERKRTADGSAVAAAADSPNPLTDDKRDLDERRRDQKAALSETGTVIERSPADLSEADHEPERSGEAPEARDHESGDTTVAEPDITPNQQVEAS